MTRFLAIALAATMAACAGRDPQPIATVQMTDANASCAMITAEIQANNIKVQELAGEEGAKVAQNVAAGVGGLLIPVLSSVMTSRAQQARKSPRCKPGNNI